MHAIVHGERTLTDLDFARLTKLLSQQLPPTLADLLAGAEVMKSRAVNADVVTMYSRVEVVDAYTAGALAVLVVRHWWCTRCGNACASGETLSLEQ